MPAISTRETWKNSLRILTASIISQAVSVAVYPFVAHLYSPENIAVLSILLAIVGILTTFASLGFEQSIMVQKDEKRKTALYSSTLVIVIIIVVLIATVERIMGGEKIANLLNTKGLAPFTWIIAPLVLLSSIGYVSTYYFNSLNHFRLSARYTLWQGLSNNAFKLILSPVYGGLYIANLIGQTLGLLTVVRRLLNVKLSFNLPLIRANWRFPAFTLPQQLVTTITNNLPFLILATAYNSETLGYFSLCMSFGYRPICVVASSINQAFFHHCTANRYLGLNYTDIIRRFLLIGIPTIVVLFVLIFIKMDPLVAYLFGEKWIGVPAIMRVFLPLFGLTILSNSLTFIPLMLGRQALAMTLEIISSIARIATMIYSSMNFDIVLTVRNYAIVHSLFLLIQLIWYLSLLQKDKR